MLNNRNFPSNPRTPTYRGRFAPSPTGPLHFGSLVAAVGSYLEAKSRGGQWLVRMEDLDPPREQSGAADRILRTLEACAMAWDGDILYQSARGEAYRAALARLEARGLVYPCSCTRREIADSMLTYAPARVASSAHAALLAGAGGTGSRGGVGSGRANRSSTGDQGDALVYPGTCRNGLALGKTPRAARVRVGDAVIEFHDALQGRMHQDLAAAVGDFVLLRADKFYAYQLAVVVDDAEQGITDVVRGGDLLDSTPRQIHLQHLLGLATPRYLHLPVAVNGAGEKLSKQTRATPADGHEPVPLLAEVVDFLGQAPPAQLKHATLSEFWSWALENWNPERIPRRRSLPAVMSAI